jgi:hypothetical protein
MVELGINIEENIQNEDSKDIISEKTVSENDAVTSTNSITNENDQNENDSIESIPFIAEPSKEKRSRSNK